MPDDSQVPNAGSAKPDPKDRRKHARYPFAAEVDIAPSGHGQRIKSRITDLSQRGCYVKTDTPYPLGTAAKLRITKGKQVLEAQARAVFSMAGKGMGLMFTELGPDQKKLLEAWLTNSIETSWLATSRRRSQRILLKYPVRITGGQGNMGAFEEDTHTLAISAHGALILLSMPVKRGSRLRMRNIKTEAELECIVAHVGEPEDNRLHIGVEFSLPNPSFWHASFPPSDWTIRHPDAKGRNQVPQPVGAE